MIGRTTGSTAYAKPGAAQRTVINSGAGFAQGESDVRFKKMKLVIFDIDGTLADCSNRIHHLTKKPKDWDAFFAGMDRDPPNEPVVEVCRAMYARGYRIVLCTGRFERDRALTEGWLHGNQVPFHEIRMRRDDDKRSDTETKREMIRPSEKEHILFVIEDRGRIAEMWRDMGLVCLQCAKGDF